MPVFPILCGDVGVEGVNVKELKVSYSLHCGYIDIDGACLSPCHFLLPRSHSVMTNLKGTKVLNAELQ